MTADGRSKPTGPLVNTAKPMMMAAGMNQPRPFSRDAAAERVMLSQKTKNVHNVSTSKSESGLAKWAAAQNMAALASTKPAKSPTVGPNISRPSS